MLIKFGKSKKLILTDLLFLNNLDKGYIHIRIYRAIKSLAQNTFTKYFTKNSKSLE